MFALDQGDGYLIVADGAFAHNTIAHISEGIDRKNFDVILNDVTDRLGILSVQGPNSRRVIHELIGVDLNAETLPMNQSKFFHLENSNANGLFDTDIDKNINSKKLTKEFPQKKSL